MSNDLLNVVFMKQLLPRLSNKYTVFYSVAWQARDRAGDIHDGEADFVIAHPELGLLVIEVKGGGIRFDGSSGAWFSGPYSIKDPAEQAMKNRYELFRKLQDLPGWDKSWMTIGRTVAFPDIVVENTDLRLDLPNEIILDNSSLENIEPKLQEIFRYYAGGEGGAGAPGQNRIEDSLKSQFGTLFSNPHTTWCGNGL